MKDLFKRLFSLSAQPQETKPNTPASTRAMRERQALNLPESTSLRPNFLRGR